MSRGPDACTLVERAILAMAESAGCPVTIDGSDSKRWASATFAGAQHMLTLATPPSPALDNWLAALSEAEFTLRGHLVADCAAIRVLRNGDAVTINLEILTVEDR